MGVQRETAVDGLGRIISVVEDPGGLDYETTYIYNPADQLIQSVQGVQVRTFHYDSAGRLLSEFHPESGTKFYSYDGNGNLTSSVDARGKRVQWEYDDLDRVTRESYRDINNRPETTPAVDYFYDDTMVSNGKGRLTKVTDAGGQSLFEYDVMGRVSTLTRTTLGKTVTADYTYNLLGGITLAEYDGITDIVYEYDNQGRPVGVGVPSLLIAEDYTLTYDASGGSEETTTYRAFDSTVIEETVDSNNRLQPTSREVVVGGSSTQLDLSFDFTDPSGDNDGNIWGITNNLSSMVDPTPDQVFSYDSLNRISSFQNGSQTVSYTYDLYGNRLTATASGTPPTGFTGFDSYSLTVDSLTNRIVKRSVGSDFAYDATGNITADPERDLSYLWDGKNRMSQVTDSMSNTTTYTYDYLDRRVIKDDGSDERIYFYDITGKVLFEFPDPESAQDTSRMYLGDKLVLDNTTTSGPHLMFGDHLGSVRLKMDLADADVFCRETYSPFGQQLSSSCGGDTHTLKFTGKERDEETGLDYFGARYCDSGLGRFTSIDPSMRSFDLSDPRSLNRYAYVLNNPLAFVDPDGRVVRVHDAKALELIRNSLPQSERGSVVLDNSGNISALPLAMSGVPALGFLPQGTSANLQALRVLVESPRLLDVLTSSSVNIGGRAVPFSFKSMEQVKKEVAELGGDPGEVVGPDSFLGAFQLSGESPTGNPAVMLSNSGAKASTAPAGELAVTAAHEIFGHALLFFLGQPFQHPNPAVDKHILEVEDRTRRDQQ